VINPANNGRRDPVSLRAISGSDRGATGAATDAMLLLAERAAATLSNALNLVDADEEASGTPPSGDPYGVDEVARSLAGAVGGSPTDQGHIARALHDFTRESAVLLAARPESGALAHVQAAIDRAGAVNGVGPQTAIAVIDGAAADIARGPR
jgi:hypothetical protein